MESHVELRANAIGEISRPQFLAVVRDGENIESIRHIAVHGNVDRPLRTGKDSDVGIP